MMTLYEFLHMIVDKVSWASEEAQREAHADVNALDPDYIAPPADVTPVPQPLDQVAAIAPDVIDPNATQVAPGPEWATPAPAAEPVLALAAPEPAPAEAAPVADAPPVV